MSNHVQTDFATFEAFDRLPAALRHEVAFAARVYDAIPLLEQYRREMKRSGYQVAIEVFRNLIWQSDENDVLAFARGYRRRYGVPLPHVAAEAGILRFEPVRSRPRTLMGRGARCRSALAASERLLPG